MNEQDVTGVEKDSALKDKKWKGIAAHPPINPGS
jgi:hypothetical protein